MAQIIWAASVPAAVAVPGVQGGVSPLSGADRLRPACGPLRSGCRGRTRPSRQCCSRRRRCGLDRLRPALEQPQNGCRGRSGTWLRGLSLQAVSGIRDGHPGWFGARRSSQRPDKDLGVWVASLCRPRCMSPVSRRTPAPAIGDALDLALTLTPSRCYPAVTVGPNVRLHRRQISHYVWPK